MHTPDVIFPFSPVEKKRHVGEEPIVIDEPHHLFDVFECCVFEFAMRFHEPPVGFEPTTY